MPGQGSFADYQAAPRMSLESARSSFDTGAQGQPLRAAAAAAGAVPAQRLSSGSSSGESSGRASDSATAAILASSQQLARAQLEGQPPPQQQQQAAQQAAKPRPSVEAALRRMSAEEVVGSAGQQRTAMYVQQQQQQYANAVLESAAAVAVAQQQRAAMEAALQQRRQLLQVQAIATAASGAAPGARPSEESCVCPLSRSRCLHAGLSALCLPACRALPLAASPPLFSGTPSLRQLPAVLAASPSPAPGCGSAPPARQPARQRPCCAALRLERSAHSLQPLLTASTLPCRPPRSPHEPGHAAGPHEHGGRQPAHLGGRHLPARAAAHLLLPGALLIGVF